MRERGATPADVFARAEVDVRILDDEENVISFSSVGRLLAVCASETQCPHLGLLLGQRIEPTQLDVIAAFIRHAPNVRSGLSDLARHLPLFDRGAIVSLGLNDGSATLSYGLEEPNIVGSAHICEGSVAVMTRLLRDLCGPSWRPDEVLFAHRPRGAQWPYQNWFNAPVRFNSALTGLTFSAHWLDQPIGGADSSLRKAMAALIRKLELGSARSFVDEVRRHMLISLPHERVDEDTIARNFVIDRSTLRRKLAREGVSFRALLREIRFKIALQLIEESDIALSEVAMFLGYQDLTAFTRAFRHWSNLSPSEWRKQARRPKTTGNLDSCVLKT